jgi:hypothetical protein
MDIYILSETIQAGKTTNLEGWYKTKKTENHTKLYGILSPDRDGIRHFVAISPEKDESIPVEVVF